MMERQTEKAMKDRIKIGFMFGDKKSRQIL